MRRNLCVGVLAALMGIVAADWWRSKADDRTAEKPAAREEEKKDESPELAAVRKTADEYTRAFNGGDAKALAAFCTKDCEYVGPDEETFQGRAAIEKAYSDFFKKNPKAKIAVEIETVRLFGRNAALEEGLLRLTLPNAREPEVTKYSVLHVREDDGWKMASIREWDPDPEQLITLKDIDWLVGSWEAKGDWAELRITYAYEESRAFLRGTYSLKRDGKDHSTGMQIIGKDPEGGLRSWVFDGSGIVSESHWTRDDGRWVIEAEGTLPDGSETSAVNLLVPVGKDHFTWQTVERTIAGSSVPTPPLVKVNRVKGGK